MRAHPGSVRPLDAFVGILTLIAMSGCSCLPGFHLSECASDHQCPGDRPACLPSGSRHTCQCPDHTACQGGICVGGACQRCTGNAQCDTGKVCRTDGTCGPCETSAQCGAGLLCHEGTCGSVCRGDSDCFMGTDGFGCRVYRPVDLCDHEGANLYRCEACASGGCGCAPGQHCEAGDCSCATGADCAGGLVCARGFCAPCQGDSDCGCGRVCSVGRCRAPCTNDRECTAFDPAFRHCVDGRCVLCRDDLDCKNGSLCYDNGCVVPCQSSTCGFGSCTANGRCSACSGHSRGPPSPGTIPACAPDAGPLSPTCLPPDAGASDGG